MVGDGGELYQGTKPHVDRAAFEAALEQGRVDETLNRFETRDGDFFFLQARTVHALGNNCLLYEVQQSSDITFRVWDWGRVGLDGKPRPLHVKESLETIDFSRTGFGAVRAEVQRHAAGGLVRRLADCAFFTVQERLLAQAEVTSHVPTDKNVCSLVTCLAGAGELRTQGGALALSPMQTVLVPASAGGWLAKAATAGFKLMHAQPKFAADSH
jgi:mannose-6-phosphate isomerase